MVFSSLVFLFIFLVVTLLGYFILPTRARNAFLLIVSLFFYAWGEPTLVLLMMVSIVFNYAAGRVVSRYKRLDRKATAKAALVVACVFDVGVLFFYKYLPFLFENASLFLKSPLPGNEFFKNLVMPIGISFYTFQMMSYVIDVYRDDAEAQKSIINFGCYVTLFPQLIAGPIVQYKDIAREINFRTTSFEKFASGTLLFMAGLSKKVLLANSMGVLYDTVEKLDFSSMSALTALLGSLAFSFQIYFDFSGYSDMARGLGRMFGFEFIKNFNYPYISRSVTEFWRRWHISLSTWFRDYVYIPLGGNRHGFACQIRNLALVWLLTGIWHGAKWNYPLWGIWFGLLIILEKLFLLKRLKALPRFVGHVWAMLCAWFGWVIFSHEELSRLFDYVGILFGKNGNFVDSQGMWLLTNYALLFLVCAVGSTPAPRKAWKLLGETRYGPVLRVLALLVSFVFVFAYVTASTYNPFIYFRF